MNFKLQLVFLGVFLTLCLGEIVEEGEITDENGDVIPVAQETSEDCSYRRYTSIYGDNVHVIVDDFTNDVSLVLMSENPDVCYVRTLTAEEKVKNGKCDNGTLRGQEAAPSQVKKQFSIGGEIDFETLPGRTQELCQGRKALELKDLSEYRPQDVPNEKRACRNVLVEEYKQVCKFVCHGWWWGQKCGDDCNTIKISYWKEDCSRQEPVQPEQPVQSPTGELQPDY